MQVQYRSSPLKHLTRKKKNNGGRNNKGRIVSYHRGGACKRRYRMLDTARRLFNIPAVFLRYELDPNRTSLLALICYQNGFLSYIFAVASLERTRYIVSAPDAPSLLGNHLMLANIVVGSHLHNVGLLPNSSGKLVRSNGCSAQLLRKKDNQAFVKLASGEVRTLPLTSFATIGSLLNTTIIKQTKAGNSRWIGRRPVVRGVAMNPVDHPMGGGEGKTSGGRPSVSPWGLLTKGQYKTRSKRKKTNYLLHHRKSTIK